MIIFCKPCFSVAVAGVDDGNVFLMYSINAKAVGMRTYKTALSESKRSVQKGLRK